MMLTLTHHVQEVDLVARAVPDGRCVWNEALQIDLDVAALASTPDDEALLLFQVLQHPTSIGEWHKLKADLAGDVQCAAWAFLQLTDDIHARISQPGKPLQLQLFSCASSLDIYQQLCTASDPRLPLG